MSRLARWTLITVGMVGAIFVAAALQAASTTRPFWTQQAMFRFGDDLFFAGRATCVASAEEGRQRAYNAAFQEILNYTRTQEIVGIPVETQMIYEEENSDGCRSGQGSVWRLLRAPAARLDKLNRMASQQSVPQDQRISGVGPSKRIRDLTPKIGMYKDDAFEAFGQPKSVSMVRNGTEVNWEYPRFGLTLVFDSNGYLLRWNHGGPGASQQGNVSRSQRKSDFEGLEGSIDLHKSKKGKEDTIDLSTRLEKMQLDSQDREKESDATRYCERAYPRDRKLQNSCIQYEIEKKRQFNPSGGDGWFDADRAAKVMCASRWPNDTSLRDSCQKFEREKLLNAQSRRY